MNIPSLEVKDTIFYKKDSKYCFQVCSYNIHSSCDADKPIAPENNDGKSNEHEKIEPPKRSMLKRSSVFAEDQYKNINAVDEGRETTILENVTKNGPLDLPSEEVKINLSVDPEKQPQTITIGQIEK